MLSNKTFNGNLFGGLILVYKGIGMQVQRMLKMSKVYTLVEILSKLFGKKSREIKDLIYEHGLTN